MKLVVSWSYYTSHREELDNLIKNPDDEDFIPTKD